MFRRESFHIRGVISQVTDSLFKTNVAGCSKVGDLSLPSEV